MLTCPTMEDAAKAAQVSKTTLYAWLKEEDFLAALEEARQEQSRDALAFLRACLLRAVKRLSDLLDSQNEAIAHRAATTLLDHGLKAIALEDQEQRIAELEARLEARPQK